MSKVPEGFVRVSKRRRCPVCGRPDWCLVASDGTRAICPRTISKHHLSDDLGWLHVLTETVADEQLKVERPKREEPTIDFDFLADTMRQHITPDEVEKLGENLGLSAASLQRLFVGWSHQHRAYSFPMFNGKAEAIGIRLRKPDGFKYAVEGSANGIFVPANLTGEGLLVIVEGPTDTAACLDLGFDAIGRPSCSSAVAMTCDFVADAPNRDWCIIMDWDDPKRRPDGSVFYPGQEGAAKLAEALRLTGKSGKMIAPPVGVKDTRKWKERGASHGSIIAKFQAAPWIKGHRA